MTSAIGVEVDCPFTVGMLKKAVHAAVRSGSFVAAAEDLQALAEVKVTAKRVERWTQRVGDQRVGQSRDEAERYQSLPLPERRKSPADQIPQVACVMMDGGRIQIRDRRRQESDGKGFWKESLVGCCLSMTSEEHRQDPAPMIPKTFVDPVRMSELSREIKGFSGNAAADKEPPETSPDDREGRPEALVRSVVATRDGLEAFGPRLVAAAHARGFHAAKRKAFVADGAASNWSVQKQHFSHYTPILDFVHAICYIYAAALAGRRADDAWREYAEWAQWLWEGSVDKLIAAIAARAVALGPPPDDDASPAAIVSRTLTYLQNQRSRMQYHEYRRLGLPITSSHIESAVKQVHRRVKGTEKFWSRGAEPMLQLVADHLSETPALARFWKKRPAQLAPYRCYQTAA